MADMSTGNGFESLDLSWIRAQFPSLELRIGDHAAIYADGPGGTQVPKQVIDAVSNYLVTSNANTHGTFLTSLRTNEVIGNARQAMADMLGCDTDEVFFGPNMTTLAFALSRAMGREIGPGDEVVVTRLDHEANVSPWRVMAEDRGATLRYVDIHEADCTLDMNDLRAQLGERTRLVAVGLASNAVGTINDVAAIARMAHEVGALVFVDAVHYAPHGLMDVHALDCDFLACSTYKFFGPHLGVVYGKREHLTRLTPHKLRVVPDELPDRWETGTHNHEGLAGLVAAVDYLAGLGRRVTPGATSRREALQAAFDAIRSHERSLSEKAVMGLLSVAGLRLYGIVDPARFAQRTPTFAVRIEGHTPEELARVLAERGIFVWSGNYYALGLTERLGVEESGGMLRIGFVHYNTADEVERVISALRDIVRG